MKRLLLKLFNYLEPLLQGKIRCKYYNFQQMITFSKKPGKFSITQVSDKSYLLKVGKEEIYIAIPNRVGFYREGIQKRLSDLKASFFSDKEIQDDSVVIDIGSNIGEYAISFSNNVTVHAFEMDPNVMPSLISNTRGFKNIHIHKNGLWSKHKTMHMYVKSNSADTSLIDNGASEKHLVECFRLDDIESIKTIDEITILKCDAEGAEPEVLSGAINTLIKTKLVAIDCGPERGIDGERTDKSVKDLLISLGFDIVKERFGNREILVAQNSSFSK